MPTIVVAIGVLLAGCSGSGAESAGQTAPSRSAPLTSPAAQSALDTAGRPAAGTLENGTFTISDPIFGGSSAEDGRLTSQSWDVYYVREGGGVGAWGAGLDIFTSPEKALASAREQAKFFGCPEPRRTVESFPVGEPDWVDAASCRRSSGNGFRATASMSRDTVTTNLTVTGRSRAGAEAALISVWPSLEATAVEVLDHLP